MGNYIVSGAGNSAVNGTYIYQGVYNAKPWYLNGAYSLYFYASSFWFLASGLPADAGPSTLNYYYIGSSAATPPATDWIVYQPGIEPAPTVAGSGTGLISGTPSVGSTLSIGYSYSDAENDPEGATMIQWYRCNNAADAVADCTLVLDTTKPTLTYTAVAGDAGKYLKVKVTPVATSGTLTGTAVTTEASAQIQAVP
jgi:hypothetical protein